MDIYRQLAVDLDQADTLEAIVALFLGAAEREIGFSSFNAFPMYECAVPEEETICFSPLLSPAAARQRMVDTFGLADRDLGPLTQSFEHPAKSLDLTDILSWDRVRRTESFHQLWRAVGVERALQACFGSRHEPLAIFTLGRASQELPFSSDDVASLERLRRPTERRLAEIVREKKRSPLSDAVLPALYEGLPMACLVLNHQGLLLWANKAAQDAFRLRLTLIGGTRGRAILTPRPELAQVRASVLEIGAAELCCATFQNALRAQRVERPACPPVWVVTQGDACRPATVASPNRPRELSSKEMEIAHLAAEGCGGLTIAHRLGIAESTVKVHLRNVYRKLGVHSRAELTRAVFSFP
jgi:DNA-binding CsgD family transcriptional regulator/PAS domain-containing protein